MEISSIECSGKIEPARPRRTVRRLPGKQHAKDVRKKVKPKSSSDSDRNSNGTSTPGGQPVSVVKYETKVPSLFQAFAQSTTAEDVAAFMMSGYRNNGPAFLNAPSPNYLHSPAVNKAQLKSTFHNVYFPQALVTSFCPSRWLLFNTDHNSSTRLAEHALHLTQLGAMSGEQRAIHEALRVYQAAMLRVRARLADPKAASDDQVFVVILLLSLCERYTTLSADDTGRRHHLKGVERLMEIRGAENVCSYPMKISLQLYQQSALWDALVSRKNATLSSPAWLSILGGHVDSKCKWRLPQLTSLVLKVPRLLEKADAVRAKGDAAELVEIVDALNNLKTFERDLRDWMNAWYRDLPFSPYRKVTTKSCKWLDSLVVDSASIFPWAIEFDGTAMAKAHEMFWLALMSLMEASMELSEMLPDMSIPTSQMEWYEKEISEYADGLCMVAMYMCNPENGVDGCIDANDCVQFAALWFEKNGEKGKVKWCSSMVKGIERRGIRAPRVQDVRGRNN